MNDSKGHKAAAEPPLDCRVGRWIETKAKLPKHGEWVLAVYRGVYQPRYVRFWRDGGKNPHFGGPNADSDGKGSQPATHWMRIAEVPNAEVTGRASAACEGPR